MCIEGSQVLAAHMRIERQHLFERDKNRAFQRSGDAVGENTPQTSLTSVIAKEYARSGPSALLAHGRQRDFNLIFT